uniref:Protein CASC3 n=1 Tax=Kryptolebias marmoratus TaxID=37003 RepID=A0A3Q3BLX6_KRYMA
MADRRRRRRRASQDSEDDDESGSGSDSGRSGSPDPKSRIRDPEPVEAEVTRTEPKSDVESECVSSSLMSERGLGVPAGTAHSTTLPGPRAQVRFRVTAGSISVNKCSVNRWIHRSDESTDDPETKAGGKSGQQLDDDEDRKNPAYIPRKGLFFEHDVRGHAQEEERPKGRNRKLWKDEGRWEHDKFREEEQAPKSREELIAIYGYDIRNGGGGPGDRAYRQRRPRRPVFCLSDKQTRPVCVSADPVLLQTGTNDGGTEEDRDQSGLGRTEEEQSNESNAPQVHPRERPGSKAPLEPAGERGGASRGGRGPGGRGGSAVVIEDVSVSQGRAGEEDLSPASATTAASPQPGGYQSPRRQQQEQRASPPTERPVERKSYSLARRTRSRPSDLGSKQASVEESASGGNTSSPSRGGGGAGLAELDQDVARLSLARQNWSQSPTSYMRSEMRGLPNALHMAGGPPQFSNIEEMGVSSNRAKRYSSQRQRAVPEPAPPLHLGVMEGHYYEPMSYQGPIYTHGDGAAPIPPQGMLVQPEMHIPHPGLHPHQSGGPIANPALYGAPPVSLSPGQPQQLLPPPFYPPPGVMTFPYPTMYPNPQGQTQVTYGGVTYYDTMQQQAQPKPSPPRRTSQPVTVKPPPPEVPFASE